jgi:tRNA pseudouridine55 synthase
MVSGTLLVDKPEGLTSHDVVARIRKLAGQRRVGHSGTLDPFATGLLAVCLGRATRLAGFLSALPKTYQATVRFGFATDTYDSTGVPTGEVPESEAERLLSSDALQAALEAFRGPLRQTPPPYSAKKHKGERMHRLARRGVQVVAPPVSVVVHELDLVRVSGSRAELRLRVSSGTYVRAIAHDLGQRLGCGAHLEVLRRTAIGSFRIEEAWPLSALETGETPESLLGRLLSPAETLRDYPALLADGETAERIGHGRRVLFDELEPEPERDAKPSREGRSRAASRSEPASGGIGPRPNCHQEVGPRGTERSQTFRILRPSGELLAVSRPEREGGEVRLVPVLVWAE